MSSYGSTYFPTQSLKAKAFFLFQFRKSCFIFGPNCVPSMKVIFALFSRFSGTAGAILTSPLEIVKTRLQSSKLEFGDLPPTDGPSNPANSSKSVKLPSFSVERLVTTQEVLAEQQFRPAVQVSASQGGRLAMSNKSNLYVLTWRLAQVNLFDSEKSSQAKPNPGVIQCLR